MYICEQAGHCKRGGMGSTAMQRKISLEPDEIVWIRTATSLRAVARAHHSELQRALEREQTRMSLQQRSRSNPQPCIAAKKKNEKKRREGGILVSCVKAVTWLRSSPASAFAVGCVVLVLFVCIVPSHFQGFYSQCSSTFVSTGCFL
jgi:hypothetical protein